MSNNCEPIKSCGQTSIPEVDETQLECPSITTTNCVNVVKDYLPLQILKDSSLTDLIDKIVQKTTSISQNFLVLTPTTQPTTPVPGTIYTDSTTGRLRHYNGVTGQWEDFYLGAGDTNTPTLATKIVNEQTNLTTSVYTLPNVPIIGSQDVYFNGRLVEPSAYSLAGNQITFTQAPYTNIVVSDVIVTIYLDSTTGTTTETRVVNQQTNLTNSTYTIPSTPITGSQEVYFNGRLVEPSAYSLAGNQITFTQAPYTNINITDIIVTIYSVT